MNHKYRGIALIFYYESSRADTEILSKALKNLHFHVTTYKDCSVEEIKLFTKDTSKENDHSDFDCILIAVLSYGGNGCIYAQDMPCLSKAISSYFTAKNCPSLAGKPKIFIFFDGIQTDLKSSPFMYNTKMIENDFLIVNASVPGYVSYSRDPDGAWFIQTLCKELYKNAKQIDIMSLLTNVIKDVAFEFESQHPEKNLTGNKQIPNIISSLNRLLTFTDR